MKYRFSIGLPLIFCLFILEVQAGLNVVPPGGTVFIGEEQLDISASGVGPGSQIAWWAPGTSVVEAPADVITVSNPSSFSALSSSFSGREGIWYSLADKTPVLKIKQPKLSIRIYDTTSDFDAAGKWIPRGDLASFQIETNLYEIGNRGNSGGVPVDIIIKSPEGSEYSAVSGPSGLFSLTSIPIRSSSYDTGPVWNTGDADIGTYQIHAECTANEVNNNNSDPGAAVSKTISVLIQGTNPLSSGRSGNSEIEGGDTVESIITTRESITSQSPAPLTPDTVQLVSPTGTPQQTARISENQTTTAPLLTAAPSLAAVVQTTAPPITQATTPPPSPAAPARTSLSGLLAILAIAGLLARISR